MNAPTDLNALKSRQQTAWSGDAAFVGGRVALAWARVDKATRARLEYLASIEAWRHGGGYRIPGEFVVATAFLA